MSFTNFIGIFTAILVIFVPAMMGYTAKANNSTVDSEAKQIYVNAQAIIAEMESKGAELPVGYIDNTTAAEYKDIFGTGDDSVTFQSEMIRRMADVKTAQWAIFVSAGDDVNADPGTVMSAAYCKEPAYIGTYPHVPENGKGYFKDLPSAIDAAKEYFW